MEFDDFFENDRNHRKHRHDQQYEHNVYSQRSHSHSQHNEMLPQLLSKLQDNPKLKSLLIIVAFVVLIVVVFAIILLFPFILRLISFISENGVQGIIDAVWKGSK